MMHLTHWSRVALLLVLLAELGSAQFTNGGFETGDFTGWTLEFGTNDSGGVMDWSTTQPAGHPTPVVVTASTPLQPGQTLPVPPYVGTRMARINDIFGDNHATRISQTTPLTAAALVEGGSVLVEWGAMLVECALGSSQGPFLSLTVTADEVTVAIIEASVDGTGSPGSGWVPAGNQGGTLWYGRGVFCIPVAGFPLGTPITVQLAVGDCRGFVHGGFAFIDGVRFGDCCASPPLEMTGWWPLQANGTDIARGHDGTPSGDLIATFGMVGQCYDFGGVTGVVTVPSPSDRSLDVHASEPFVANSGDFSVDAWILAETLQTDQVIVSKWSCLPQGLSTAMHTGLISQAQSECLGVGYSFSVAGNQLHLLLDKKFGGHDFFSDPIPALGDLQWHHVAVTVDRNVVGGVRFYFDGALVAPSNLDPTPVPDNLENDGPFLIGHGASYLSTSPHFDGRIDEVEFFQRVVPASDLDAIYKAGRGGKCKSSCRIPKALPFMFRQNTVVCNVVVANYSTVQHTFEVSAEGMPGDGGPCDGPIPTSFTFPNGSSVIVPPHDFRIVKVVISRPAGLSGCMKSNYAIMVTDTASLDVDVCLGQLADNPFVFIGSDIAWTHFQPGDLIPVDFGPVNPDPDPVDVDWTVAVTAFSGHHEVEPTISLNGLPPGQPVLGTLVLGGAEHGGGDHGRVTVQAELTELLSFGVQEIGFYVDVDFDGTKDLVASLPVYGVPLDHPCAPLPSGGVAWWTFDQSTGQVLDEIGGHHGTLVDDARTGAGFTGPALHVDGTTDFVSVPDSPTLDFGAAPSGSFSIEGWIAVGDGAGSFALAEKLTFASGSLPLVFNASTSQEGPPFGAAPRGYSLQLVNGVPHLLLADGPSQPLVSTFSAGEFVADGGWHHVAVCVDRSVPNGGRFYVDGQPVGSPFDPSDQPGSLANAVRLRLGHSRGDDPLSVSAVDDLAIYGRALSASEVAALASVGPGGKCQ